MIQLDWRLLSTFKRLFQKAAKALRVPRHLSLLNWHGQKRKTLSPTEPLGPTKFSLRHEYSCAVHTSSGNGCWFAHLSIAPSATEMLTDCVTSDNMYTRHVQLRIGHIAFPSPSPSLLQLKPAHLPGLPF